MHKDVQIAQKQNKQTKNNLTDKEIFNSTVMKDTDSALRKETHTRKKPQWLQPNSLCLYYPYYDWIGVTVLSGILGTGLIRRLAGESPGGTAVSFLSVIRYTY